MRPWESAVGSRPWELAETIYPRVISIYRRPLASDSAAALGPLPYQEAQASAGTLVWDTSPVYSGIACSIQEETRGQRSTADLPGSDLVPLWRIFIPFAGLAKGSVEVHDNIKDEIGAKYRVLNPYWDSLGYRLSCTLLEN